MYDVVSVGHFSIDSIQLPDRAARVTILGGSPTYVSLAARRLDARVAAVSKVGSEFPEAYRWWLQQENISLYGMTKPENDSTTRFELQYNDNFSDRTLTLKSKAPSITPDDLADLPRTSVAHVCPIAGEVDYELMQKLRDKADILSLDPQGFVRQFSGNGDTSYGPMKDPRILDLVKIYKSSAKEIEAVTGSSDLKSAVKAVHDRGVEIVLITLGAKGATIFFDGTTYDIPACKIDKVVDPTGAGDAFIGGFLAEYVNGANTLRCACVGTAVASFVTEEIGPTSFGEKTQIYQRAHQLYETEIEQKSAHLV